MCVRVTATSNQDYLSALECIACHDGPRLASPVWVFLQLLKEKGEDELHRKKRGVLSFHFFLCAFHKTSEEHTRCEVRPPRFPELDVIGMLTYDALVHQIRGLDLDLMPPRRVSVTSQTLNNQGGTPGLAGGRGPGQDHSEREECEAEKRVGGVTKEKIGTESWRG